MLTYWHSNAINCIVLSYIDSVFVYGFKKYVYVCVGSLSGKVNYPGINKNLIQYNYCLL